MTKARRKLGINGENLALEFLERKGMQLFCRNFRVRRGEIDLIMWDKEELVFIEVRTRTDDHFGTPVETINNTKRHKIAQTARYFLQQKKISPEVRCRFDLVGVLVREGATNKIEHVANAFWVGE
jgi:putative endonuclease